MLRLVFCMCVLLGVSIAGVLVERPITESSLPEKCDIDEQYDCEKCKLVTNYMGYLADPCYDNKFYQCVKYGTTWTAYPVTCPACTVWGSDVTACVTAPYPCTNITTADGDRVEIIGNDTCRETRNGAIHVRTVHEDIYKYVVEDPNTGSHVMPCAPGTAFSLETCGCTVLDNGNTEQPPPERIGCLNFDTIDQMRQWGFSVKGLNWVTNNGVVKGDGIKGAGAYFDGSAKFEMPFFTNNYGYTQFSVSLYFKRDPGVQGTMGLLSNGACVPKPSLSMTSISDTEVILRATNADDSPVNDFTSKVSADQWNRLVLVFDARSVTYYVNMDAPVTVDRTTGPLGNRNCPLILGMSGDGEYFQGHLDEVCIYKGALSKEEIVRDMLLGGQGHEDEEHGTTVRDRGTGVYRDEEPHR